MGYLGIAVYPTYRFLYTSLLNLQWSHEASNLNVIWYLLLLRGFEKDGFRIRRVGWLCCEGLRAHTIAAVKIENPGIMFRAYRV